MSEASNRTFTSDFKRFFVRGLVVLLPTVLTLWLVVYAYRFVYNAIAEPINRGIRWCMYELAPYWQPLRTWFDPAEGEITAAIAAAGSKPPARDAVVLTLREANIEAWWVQHWYLNVIGLIVAIVAVYVAGRVLGGYLGRRVYRRMENLMTRMPIMRQVYPSVKQVVDFFFAEDRTRRFSRVVLCEYPRQGVWVMAFQTGPAFKHVEAVVGEAVTVFIPSTPGTITGYTAVIPRKDVIDLPISVDEAIRFAVSGGVLVPDRETSSRGAENAMLPKLAASGRPHPAETPVVGTIGHPPAGP
jgi:uncharacterized membrane protein